MSTSDNTIFLKGKSILFIGQVFYDYHSKIIAQLEDFGARVIFLENRIFLQDESVSNGVLASFRKTFKPNEKDAYVQEILAKTSAERFDYLFCIGGFSITNTLLVNIRQNNPNVKCILYLWDSFSIWNYSKLLPLFDYKFSFDGNDCALYEDLQYLPLFYTEEYQDNLVVEKDIDLLYIGSVGALTIGRCQILKEIQELAHEKQMKIFFWVYYPLTNGPIKKLLNRVRQMISPPNHYLNIIDKIVKQESFIKHEPLNRDEIVLLLKRAKCVIDIPVQNQVGLTIRTIETLAMGKKLITTNQHVFREKFYSSKMIRIIDDHIDLDENFINGQYEVLDVNYLWIGNWIKTMFKVAP